MALTAQNIGLVIGWLTVGWVGVRALLFSLKTMRGRWRWEREYRRERDEFRRTIEVTARAARASHAILDWSGWRRFRVAAIVDEAADVKSFYFVPVDGRPLSIFAPGQYLTFRLPIEDGAAPLVRCYSLSDRPRQDYYRTTIKRISSPVDKPTTPPGRGSSFFHDRVHVGDLLDVRAPAGTFLIDPASTEAIVLLGAGIGVTPLVSMLEAMAKAGRRRVVYALFGFRNSREHPFKDYLQRLAEEHPWIQLRTSYSAPLENDVYHKDFNDRGRLSIERIREFLPSNNFRFYVCGPGEMMESLVPSLWEWGVPESHVHYEAFGPASVKRAAKSHEQLSAPCEVQFSRTGRDVTWDGSLTSLLELGESAGIVMPSGCRAGSCGECMFAVRKGRVKTVKQPGITVPPGHCLTCISIPDGAVTLDA
jgi:uncharacterized protein